MSLKKKILNSILGICILIMGVLFYLVNNEKFMIEYEHNIKLPESARNFDEECTWWIPRSVNLPDQEASGSFVMDSSDLPKLIEQFESIHLEKDSANNMMFAIPEGHVKNAEMMMYAHRIDDDLLYVTIGNCYN